MAEYGNLVAKKRNKLEEVIPLTTPYTLVIDPSNLCNFTCEFCAMHKKKIELPFKKQIMDFELYKKIIDDISMFPEKLKSIRLVGQGEPLINPNFCDMIKYAKEKGVADWIETVTNGSLLNPKLNTEIINSGINRIRISIEAIDNVGYEKLVNKKIDFDKFIDNIRDLHNKSGDCEIYCKIVDAAVPTVEEQERFKELFSDISDRIFIDRVIPLWSDFDEVKNIMAKDVKGLHGQDIKKVEVCPYSFYSLMINSDGDVTLCCADWKREYVLGNLNNDSLIDIWNGKRLKEFWINTLKGNKDLYSMCKKCVLPSFDCNDFIDDVADNILNNLGD